jgi:hypothetical protein
MDWARILAYITGTVDQELLLRNEYLVAENRILKAQVKGRLRLSDAERATLGEIGHRLGRNPGAKMLHSIKASNSSLTNSGKSDPLCAWTWARNVSRSSCTT